MSVMFNGTRFQSFKSDGTVNAAGTVQFFEIGTATHKQTYSNSALTVANADPVDLNSAGAADIWYTGDADVSVYDSAAVLIDSFSNINPATTSSSNEANLITNGSFEMGASVTAPDGWVRDIPYSGGTSEQDTDSSHGVYSWKFVSAGNGGGVLTSESFFNVTKGRSILLSWMMKSSVADIRNVVEVLWYDDADAYISSSTAYDNSTTNPTSWTLKHYTELPVSTAVKAKIRITGAHSSDATAGTVRFDGFLVNESPYPYTSNTIPNGARYGNIWSHNAGDVTNDWDITAGGCLDSTGVYWITTTALTKQADAAWAVGNAAGMLDTGAVGNSDYYIWAIARSDTGVTDYLSSLSSTAPTMPANYDYKRLIGWFKRLAGVNTLMDVNETEGGGVDVTWGASVLDITDNDPGLSEILATLSVPVGINVIANIQGILTNAAGVIAPNARFYNPAQNDETPSATLMDLPNVSTGAGFARTHASRLNIRTNTSAQVGYKIANASSADITLYIRTLGFRWARRN
jgi:hypothetical protein